MPLVIGVPGKWKDLNGLSKALKDSPSTGGRFVIKGEKIEDKETGLSLLVDVYEKNPTLHQTMGRLGGGFFDDEAIEAVKEHTCVAYLVEEDSKKGSVEFAKNMIAMASALINVGGLGVLVESAGIAHSVQCWKDVTEFDIAPGLYRTLVATVHGMLRSYTSGMHFFGLPDATVLRPLMSEGVQEYQELLGSLNLAEIIGVDYAIEKWSLGIQDDVYTVTKLERYIEGYAEDDPKWNPHGVYELSDPERPVDVAAAFGMEAPDWPQGTPVMLPLTKDQEQEFHKGIKEARESAPLFFGLCKSRVLQGLPMFKGAVQIGDSNPNICMMLVDVKEDGSWEGSLFEDFPGLEKGKTVLVTPDRILDWFWTCCGCVVGGRTLRLSRSRLAPEHQRYYDLYTGFLSFA